MSFDGLPGTTRRDAHLLVVVARRSAAGKGIVEPEPVFTRNSICNIGKCRRTLVGGNDQVRIIAVVTYDIARRNDLAAGIKVVGQIQQRRDEQLVG
jgi:hypothetical protein